MFLRRAPMLAEGYSLEAAKEVAEEEKKKQGQKQQTATTSPPKPQQKPKPSTAAKPQTPPPSSTVRAPASAGSQYNPQLMRFLGRHGVNFVEVYEAGYGPSVEKARKRQERFLQGSAQAGVGGAAAQAVRAEQRTAIVAAAKAAQAEAKVRKEYEEAKRKIEQQYKQYLQEVSTKYQQYLGQIEQQYKQAVSKLQQIYQQYKGQGVQYVNVNGRRVPLDEWYREKMRELEEWKSKAKKSVDQWRQQALASLNEWRKEALTNVEEWKKGAMKSISEYLTGVEESLSKWMMQVTKEIAEEAKRIEQWRRQVEQQYKQWLQGEIAKARKITREDALADFAEQVYQEAYKYWKSMGLSDEEARKRAEEAKRAVLEAGMKTVRAVDELTAYLDKLYSNYAKSIASAAYHLGRGGHVGALYGAENLIEEFKEEAWRKARELGIPEDVAKSIINSYVKGLEETLERGEKYGGAAKELAQLYNEYTEKIKNLYNAITSGKPSAIAQLDLLVDAFRQEAENIVKKYGLTGEDAKRLLESYLKPLQEYAEEVKSQGLKWAQARERAEQLYKTYISEAARNLAFYAMNVDVFAKKLYEKLKKELTPLVGERKAEELAKYYSSLYKSKIAGLVQEKWKTLVPATFICEQSGAGLFCKVYRNGQYITSFTTRSYLNVDLFSKPTEALTSTPSVSPEFMAMLLRLGYKPERMYIANNDKEMEQIELSYLREKNPEEYMRRLAEETKKEKSIVGKLEKGTEFVTEFFRIPTEKLYEKASKEKNPALKALGMTAAMLGAVGTGAISTAVSAWNIPGWVKGSYEFGKELATGELVKTIEKKPTVAGEIAGALLTGYALHKLGGKISETLAGKAEEITVSKPPTLATKTAAAALKAASYTPQAIETALGGAAAVGLAAGLAEKPSNIPYIAAPLAAAVALKPEKIAATEEGAGGFRVRLRGTGRTLLYYIKGGGEREIGIGSPGKSELFMRIKSVHPEITVQGLYASPADIRDIYIGLEKYGLPEEAEAMKTIAELARKGYKLGKKIPFTEVKLEFPRAGEYAKVVGEAVKEFLQQHANQVEAAYGSAMYKAHLGEFWREVHDIDIQLKVRTPEEAVRFAQELAEYINKKVGKPIVKAEGASVVFIETGKKLADIHYKGEAPEEGSVFVSEKVLGIRPKTRTVEEIPSYGAEYGALSKGESLVRLRRITPEEIKVYEKYVEQGILPKRFVEWLKEAMKGREKGYYTAPQPWRITKDAADFLYLVYKIAERTGHTELIPDILRLQEYFKQKGMLPEDFDVRNYMPKSISRTAMQLLEAFKKTSGGLETAVKELSEAVAKASKAGGAGYTLSKAGGEKSPAAATVAGARPSAGAPSAGKVSPPSPATAETSITTQAPSPPTAKAAPTTPSTPPSVSPLGLVERPSMPSPPSTGAVRAATISPPPSMPSEAVSPPSVSGVKPSTAPSPATPSPGVGAAKPSPPSSPRVSPPSSGATPTPPSPPSPSIGTSQPSPPSPPSTSTKTPSVSPKTPTPSPPSSTPPSPEATLPPSPKTPPSPGTSPPSPGASQPPSPGQPSPSPTSPSPPSQQPPSPPSTKPPSPGSGKPPSPSKPKPPKTKTGGKPASTQPPSTQPSPSPPYSAPSISPPISPPIPPGMVLVMTPLGLGLASQPAMELVGRMVEEEYVFA